MKIKWWDTCEKKNPKTSKQNNKNTIKSKSLISQVKKEIKIDIRDWKSFDLDLKIDRIDYYILFQNLFGQWFWYSMIDGMNDFVIVEWWVNQATGERWKKKKKRRRRRRDMRSGDANNLKSNQCFCTYVSRTGIEDLSNCVTRILNRTTGINTSHQSSLLWNCWWRYKSTHTEMSLPSWVSKITYQSQDGKVKQSDQQWWIYILYHE